MTIDNLLEVYVDEEGSVCIAQRDMNEDCYLAFPPDEVDEFIRMLRAAKEEAMKCRAEAHAGG